MDLPWLSSCGGRSSVLLMFECMWWQDRCSCWLFSQRVAGLRPPKGWVLVVAGQATWHHLVIPMLSDWFCSPRVSSLWLGGWNRDKTQHGHSDSEVGGRASGSPYYVTRFRGAGHTHPPVSHQVMELFDLGYWWLVQEGSTQKSTWHSWLISQNRKRNPDRNTRSSCGGWWLWKTDVASSNMADGNGIIHHSPHEDLLFFPNYCWAWQVLW